MIDDASLNADEQSRAKALDYVERLCNPTPGHSTLPQNRPIKIRR